jgi:NADH-quinone oxidoreductase E subunit
MKKELMLPEIDWKKFREILDEYSGKKWALIPLLQNIQEEFGYIPKEGIESIASALKIFPSKIQGVITFYAQFSMVPKGKYVVRVCRGTACHVRGGRSILKILQRQLGVGEGQTTDDYKYTLETVACLGTCFLAPTMMVNRNYFGRLSPPKISSILKQYR